MVAALRQQHTAPLRASGRIHRIALTGTVAPQRRKNTATSSSPIKRIMGQQHRRHAPTASTTPTHRLTVASCPRVQRGPHHHHIPPDPKNVARRGPTYRQMQQTNCRQMQENCRQMQGDSCRRYKDWPPNLAMELLAGEWGTSEGDTTTLILRHFRGCHYK